MRNLINIIMENMGEVIDEELIDEECVEHDKIYKGTWTEWQDRDGIYVVAPGSNSIYVGFCRQDEAEAYAENLNAKNNLNWHAIRHGRYKDMTDEVAMNDPEIRRKRIMYGFWVEPLNEK